MCTSEVFVPNDFSNIIMCTTRTRGKEGVGESVDIFRTSREDSGFFCKNFSQNL